MRRLPRLLPLVALIGLVACAAPREQPAASADASPGVERVVMLMRHGVRPPTKDPAIPPGYTPEKWPSWPVAAGELTPHGADGIRALARYDRTVFAGYGLLPAAGCPAAGAVSVTTSPRQRTVATGRAYAEALLPGCDLQIATVRGSPDPVFHPIEAHAVPFDSHLAWLAAMARLPEGGLATEARRVGEELQLMQRVLGCCAPALCARAGLPAGCTFDALPGKIEEDDGDRPELGGPFGVASTASQTFLLEYLEAMPMDDVAWGRLDRGRIERLLRFHPLKFAYENRPPYIAQRAAAPLMRRILEALLTGAPVTVFAGHDTNIADVGGFLEMHWHASGYPADDVPPGGAIGFELLRAADGARFVRAFFRAQTMDQLRALAPLDAANAPSWTPLAIPGCTDDSGTRCPLELFADLVQTRLDSPAPH
ncbi:MAG: histidine-type phosphatase [Steroidobacteraceae bacterium]